MSTGFIHNQVIWEDGRGNELRITRLERATWAELSFNRVTSQGTEQMKMRIADVDLMAMAANMVLAADESMEAAARQVQDERRMMG